MLLQELYLKYVSYNDVGIKSYELLDYDEQEYRFEFQWDGTKGSRTLEILAQNSMNQIKDKKYEEAVKKVHEFSDNDISRKYE